MGESSVKNTLRYRVQNTCGSDGKTLRIVCFSAMGFLVILLLSILIGMSVHSNNSNSLRASTADYNDYGWKDLPTNVQNAALTLGWHQRSWNLNIETEIYKMNWKELTTEQKAAATLLGLDKNTWCTISDDQYYEEADYATSEPTSWDTSAGTSPETDGEDLYYRDYDWEELPEEAKAAAAKFGYTSADEWKNQIDYDTIWDDLTADLRTAAIFLGYTKDTWCVEDNSDEETSAPTDPATDSATHTIMDDDWSDLADDVKNAALALGYTEEIWDTQGDMPIATFDKNWDQLTDEQRLSATMLFGYTEDTWNLDPDWEDEVIDNKYLKITAINDKDWSELSVALQQSAGLLGFTQNTWDNSDEEDGPEPPPITLMNWSELSESQQDAAASLGWTEQLWCDATDDDSVSVDDMGDEGYDPDAVNTNDDNGRRRQLRHGSRQRHQQRQRHGRRQRRMKNKTTTQ